jgi:uncharacterized protein YbjT (DUF2867 family)
MKGELEDRIKSLNFTHTVILKPGLIMGARDEMRWAESAFRALAIGLGKIHPVLKDSWAEEASVIGKAAVVAGLRCVEGEREAGLWVVGHAEIARLGRE